MNTSINDREVLRRLAGQYRELAELPIMQERRQSWTALKDLRPERPMVLFETATLLDYLAPEEIQCTDPGLQQVEKYLRRQIRHAAEVGDDIVLEPVFRCGWHINFSSMGVEVPIHDAPDYLGDRLGYHFDHPLRTPEDLDKLQPRTFSVDRPGSEREAERYQQIFGDLLPVHLHGVSTFLPALSCHAFQLIGNENLLMWTYDEPAALHRLMAFLRDDRLAWYDYLERNALIGRNDYGASVGSGSPGFTTCLPSTGSATRLREVWAWVESQETAMHSPAMFEEFFLPYLAATGNLFGFVYYGCCEGLHDRFAAIRRALPKVRAVSVSPWSDPEAMAALCGQEVVFSRKPTPASISGTSADWGLLQGDLERTVSAARHCPLEIIFRDVYRINGDRPRLARWVRLARDIIDRHGH